MVSNAKSRLLAVMLYTLTCVSQSANASSKHMDTMIASGLIRNEVTGNKYDQSTTLAPFDTTTPGVHFTGSQTDHLVLQRAPQTAAVYGYVVGCTSSCVIQTNVTNVDTGNSYVMSAETHAVKNYTTWKAYLKPTMAGGNFSIEATCTSCSPSVNSSTIVDVTFGDVWFCSGQSNMWLPMHFDTNRNQTFDALMAGKYENIRMYTPPHNNQPDGGYKGFDLFVAPPPPPRSLYGGYAGGGWLHPVVGAYGNKTCRDGEGERGDCATCCTPYPQPDDSWMYNTVDQFSAACWHFAQHLTEIAEKNNETIVPFGLIGSHWGGTMVEMWQPNATLNNQVCKNNSGGPYAPWQNSRWDIDSGALYNGQVLPFVNMTIKGALWYQGENNVFQCHGAQSNSASERNQAGGGPLACGSVADHTGYACMMKNLIDTWRKAWSVVPNTTPALFPFGVVSLAGGTSEGHGVNMGAFRYAQTGNTGILNTSDNTFVAQAYDTGDPCAGGNQCCANSGAGQAYACMAGEAPYTGQFMGSIHPRIKKIVGMRLAKAARALVYDDATSPWTGPVLNSCAVDPRGEFTLTFDATALASDAIMILQPTTNAISLSDSAGSPVTWSPDMLALLYQLAPTSPMEVQLNGDLKNSSMGTWLPVKLNAKCSPHDNDHISACQGTCSVNCTSNEKLQGWNQVQFSVPTDILSNITAIRYAWGENPCCPSINRVVTPCPPNSCPIQAFNASLPAVPFWATVKNGSCDWISTQGPPPM